MAVASVPTKMRAGHLFTGSGKSVMEFVLPIIKHMVGRENRLRSRIYAGSRTEVGSRLTDFGLGETHIERYYEKAIHDESIEEYRAYWLDKRRSIEQKRAK
jgi:hypothetical protein